jgi:hypothetical protein
MPGFNIGGGDNNEPSNTAELNRAHRWRIVSLGENLIDGDMLLFAKTLQLPGFTVEEEVITSAAIKYKFAKTVNWEDVAISFYDTVGLFPALIEWQNKVYTEDAGIQPAASYKLQSTLSQTDSTGEPINQFILHGSWPKALTHSPLSYESSDIKMVDLILSYDFATFSEAT